MKGCCGIAKMNECEYELGIHKIDKNEKMKEDLDLGQVGTL
jgi:hypothetical protein